MSLELPRLIKDELSRTGRSRRELVERLGYRNVNKGMRYLVGWLRCEQQPTGDQVLRLARALGRDVQQIEAIVQKDAATLLRKARE